MREPFHTTDQVTLYLGDCLDVLTTLPDASVDAIITDPPYGLAELPPATIAQAIAAWTGGDRTHVPDGKGGFMGKDWDRFVPPPGVWDECMRVLKPGGHLAAFAGSRTVDLMGLSIRLSGFEIRDSLMWHYGSGFPKSLDVSKAIDKAAGAQREVVGIRARGTARPAVADQSQDVAYRYGGHIEDTAPATKDAARWQGWGTALKPAHEPIVWARKPFSPVPFDEGLLNQAHHALGALVWLSLSHAKRAELSSQSRSHEPAEARCVSALVSAALATSPDESAKTDTFSSPAAASTCWSIARSWSAILGALSDPTSTSTTSTGSSTTTGLRTLSSLLGPITSPTTMPPCGCLLGGASSSAANAANTSSGEWLNWINTLSRSVPESAIEGIALAASSALVSIAADLSSVRELASSAQPSATPTTGEHTGSGTRSRTDAPSRATPPAHEPIVLARKPLTGTVAANVLEHGTGALNIDGCRVGSTVETWPASRAYGTKGKKFNTYSEQEAQTQATGDAPAGRWPTNVILTHPPLLDDHGEPIGDACADGCVPGCPVAELDAQSGIRPSGGSPAGVASNKGLRGNTFERVRSEREPDSGGASRFFPVFRYQAKASSRERPRLEDGTAHPTVKPLALIVWLVRLLTPPGGMVLDPFAGSGTTLEAAGLEGFTVIGVEQHEPYAQLCVQRLSKPYSAGLFPESA